MLAPLLKKWTIALNRFVVQSVLCLVLMISGAVPAKLAFAQTAPRVWQVCNETSYLLNAAIAAFHNKADNKLTVKGWTQLRAGQCQTISAVKGTPRYVYARSDPRHQGGVHEWKGHHDFCITAPKPNKKSPSTFKAKTDLACDLQNMQTAKFIRVLPSEERTAFVEPRNYGKKAQTAGLQRLLLDNNYAIKRIDGVSGKRTSKTLKTFVKDHKLANNLSTDDTMIALAKAAFEGREKSGISFCNQASDKIWAAIATRTNTYWESTGWWPISRKSCVRPFTKNLKREDIYVYARLQTDTDQDLILNALPGGNKSQGSSKTRVFCVSQSSFSAVSHEYCKDQGYIAANFYSINNRSTGQVLKFEDSHFSQSPLRGGR